MFPMSSATGNRHSSGWRFPALLYPLMLVAQAVLPPDDAAAATLSVRDPVRLDQVNRSEIGSGGAPQQTWDLGSTGPADATGGTVALYIDPATGINRFLQRRNERTWQLDFRRGEWQGPINVQVDFSLRDTTGRSGYINSTTDPGSRVAIGVSSGAIQERRWNDDSVRWVRGDTFFNLDIIGARAAGRYAGTLTIDVIFN